MAIWLRFKVWVLGSLAALGAILAIYLTGRKDGAKSESNKRDMVDRDTARRVENAADKARTIHGDPVDRLRRHNRLRD